jgi:RND family efflux transporter MFP subunit
MTRFWGLWAVFLLAGCSGPYSSPTVAAKSAEKAIAVRVKAVTIEAIPEIVTATGELFAEEQATLSTKVAGRLAKLNVDLGTRVEAGEVVAEIEKDDYDYKVRQAEAMVEQTRARLGLGPGTGDKVDPEQTSMVKQAAAAVREARLMFGNAEKLFHEGVVSNVDYQRAGVALEAAEARRQGALEEVYRTRAELLQRRAELDLARQQLADTVVRSPFRGAVIQRQAVPGEFLPVNGPVAAVVRWHPLRIRLEVPERLANKIHVGQRIDLKLESTVTPHSGQVVRLSPAIEAQNRSLLVEGQIGNEDGALRSGSFVEGSITVNPNAQGVSIPTRAMLSFAGIDRVLVAEQGRLAERIVKSGRRLGDSSIEIVSGLRPGDLVVIEPNDQLSAGQRVEPQRN